MGQEYERRMETVRSRDRAFKKPRYEDWPRVVDENYKRAVDLFYYVYNNWFQGDASNVDFQAFFCKLICCWSKDSPKEIPVLIQTHRSLYNQLVRRQNGLDMQEASSYRLQDDFDNHESHELMHLLYKLFVVLDGIFWYDEGVLLVFSDKYNVPETASALELSHAELPEFHENDQGSVIRVNMVHAIKAIRQMNEEEHSEMVIRSSSNFINND
ncbi:hypothetical protein MMC11_002053 [Xylographa trunciseda]|nr:hypothetical protein [Xylographa trunciseda]